MLVKALYIHWPFCVSKCPYCDFNSHVRSAIDPEAWQQALLADLLHELASTAFGPVESIFFGGGTPSLMPPAIVAALIDRVVATAGLAPDAEITLEANPSSVEAANFAALASAGVNRVSLGVQALDDAALQALGRAHGVEEALAAVAVAQRNFTRVNIDLIYGRPGQRAAAWAAELGRALALGTEHLSLYQLTIVPGTRYATLVRDGALRPLDDDASADLFELTQAMTRAAGRPAYEVSNHAASGAESRHNLTYWRYRPYAGIGPGAHGRRDGHATQRHRKPENYLAGVARNRHGLVEETPLAPIDRAREAMLMGLRLYEGVDLAAVEAMSGLSRDAFCDAQAVSRLVKAGLVDTDQARLRVTPRGMLLLNAILGEVIPA